MKGRDKEVKGRKKEEIREGEVGREREKKKKENGGRRGGRVGEVLRSFS